MQKMRILLIASIVVLVVVAFAASAQATTVSDPDDVGSRLDIRSASLVQIADWRIEVTIVFWDRVPTWLLRQHAAAIETSDKGPAHAESGNVKVGFSFFRNASGRLRIIWGEGASSCCGRAPAQHPDRFTYTAIVKGSLDNWSAKSMRGLTGRKGTARELTPGRLIDRTDWVRLVD